MENMELPLGVGRVPKWWMDITPHYVIDREDDVGRKEKEAQMSMLFQKFSKFEELGLLDENGEPVVDEEGNPLAWSQGGWGGRGDVKGDESGSSSDNGRQFECKGVFLDPKMFGIEETDPDYTSFLTGTKLPPGYADMIAKYKKGETTMATLNNEKQTSFGSYGRQAEKPGFKPSWTKPKLKKTNQGSMIRLGKYKDAPSDVNCKPKQVVEGEEGIEETSVESNSAELTSSPPRTDEDEAKGSHENDEAPAVPSQEAEITKCDETTKPTSKNAPETQNMDNIAIPNVDNSKLIAPSKVQAPKDLQCSPEEKTTPEEFRQAQNEQFRDEGSNDKTSLDSDAHTQRSNDPKHTLQDGECQTATESAKPKKYNFNDYYYNAPAVTPTREPALISESSQLQPSVVADAKESTAPEPLIHEQPDAEIAVDNDESEEYVEEYEEYVEEYEEEEEEEEQQQESSPMPANPGATPSPAETTLSDLQSLLAAKQAELQRLRAISS